MRKCNLQFLTIFIVAVILTSCSAPHTPPQGMTDTTNDIVTTATTPVTIIPATPPITVTTAEDFSTHGEPIPPWNGLNGKQFVILQWGEISETPVFPYFIDVIRHLENGKSEKTSLPMNYYRVQVSIKQVFEGTFTKQYLNEDLAHALKVLPETTFIDVPHYFLPWIVPGEEVLFPLDMVDQNGWGTISEWYHPAEPAFFFYWPYSHLDEATYETTPPPFFPIRGGMVIGHENNPEQEWEDLWDYARVRHMNHPEIPALDMIAPVEDVIKVLKTVGVEQYKYH